MCLPCLPCSEIFVEEPAKKTKVVSVYNPNAGGVVKLTNMKLKPIPQVYTAYYTNRQPIHYSQQPEVVYQQAYPQGVYTHHIRHPACGVLSCNNMEVLNMQIVTAEASDMNKKQEIKPADDDPFRMYWVREEDGTFTQRNRLTIDSGDIGPCRWYAIDGVFYAVRLPTG
ncbi:hypothetical protein BJ878DRAFT_494884 [Calycina marina]|uniref:Uncharacterized protein n=1 Tax=Calycina marina TaxID=1763456 RepID=A0A9P7Z7P6_9HELO|nr:hypothetical protein BJ878DRAFT_494884 [Calycina marina]